MYSRLEKIFDDTTIQLLSSAGGGGPLAGSIPPLGRFSKDGKGLSVARAPCDGLMGVIEVDSGARWSLAGQEIDSDVMDFEKALKQNIKELLKQLKGFIFNQQTVAILYKRATIQNVINLDKM